MRHLIRRAPHACAIALVYFATHAHAQDADAYGQALERAVQAYDARDLPAALDEFQRAHALQPNARTERALGITYFELARYQQAADWLELALANTSHSLTPLQRREAQVLLQDARARAHGSGPHLPREPEGFSARKAIALGSAAVLIGAVTVGVMALDASSDARNISDLHCPSFCDARGVEEMREARQWGNVATMSFIVGGAALTSALLFWFSDGESESRPLRVSVGPGTLVLRGSL